MLVAYNSHKQKSYCLNCPLELPTVTYGGGGGVTYAVVKRKPEKFKLTRIGTLTFAIPVQRSNQLSKKVNWELVIKFFFVIYPTWER